MSLNCCCQRNTCVASMKSEKNWGEAGAGSIDKKQFQPKPTTAFLHELRKVVECPYASVPCCQIESVIPAHPKHSGKISA